MCWVTEFYVPLNTKIGHFTDVPPSQSLDVVLKKLNNTTAKCSKLKQKTHKMLKTKTEPKPTLNLLLTCVCTSLRTTVVQNTAQNSSDNLPSLILQSKFRQWSLLRWCLLEGTISLCMCIHPGDVTTRTDAIAGWCNRKKNRQCAARKNVWDKVYLRQKFIYRERVSLRNENAGETQTWRLWFLHTDLSAMALHTASNSALCSQVIHRGLIHHRLISWHLR